MWDVGMTGDGIGMTGEASLFAERRGRHRPATHPSRFPAYAGMTHLGRGNDGGCLLALQCRHPPVIPRSHRSARSRPLTQAKGAYTHPSSMDSRLRGNDVVVGNDDGVLGVDKGHDALFEVLDGF